MLWWLVNNTPWVCFKEHSYHSYGFVELASFFNSDVNNSAHFNPIRDKYGFELRSDVCSLQSQHQNQVAYRLSWFQVTKLTVSKNMVTYAGEVETVAASLIKQTLRAEWYEQADINFLSYKDSFTVPRPILILPCTASKLTVINKNSS